VLGDKYCALSDACECPLCLIEALPDQIWYSEDENCKNSEFHSLSNSMKKLKKKAAQGHFSLKMLNRDFIVRKGTEGIDPDLSGVIKDPWKKYEKRDE
jgi:hypothetical protein